MPLRSQPFRSSLRARDQKRPRSGSACETLCLNELTQAQRERVLDYVRDGMSLREVERKTGHRRETISRYARTAGLETRRKRRAQAQPQSAR